MRRFRRYRLPAGPRWLSLLLAAGYVALRLVDAVLLGPLAALAENEARLRGADAVNRIIMTSVGHSLPHEQLVSFEKDREGRIAAYRVNTQLVNQVAAAAAEAIHQEFQALSGEAFGLPLGALSGSHILSTRGPRLPFRVLPVGSVVIDVRQDFRGEGINQTRHRIWLHADAQVQVVLPLVSRAIQVAVEVPVTETVVVGPVPDSFFGGSLGGLALPVRP